MTHYLTLGGLRHAAHHVRLLRACAQLSDLTVRHPRYDRFILKQIRNTSSASATADSSQPSQPPTWGSLARKSAPSPQRVNETNRQEDDRSSQTGLLKEPEPPQTLFRPQEDVNIDSHQETVEDTTKALSQEDTGSHGALKSFEDVSHQSSESAAISPFRVRPQVSSNAYSRPAPIRHLAPGASEQEIVPALYALLRKQAGLGKLQEVEEIVEHLICRYGEAPNTRLYAALILANHNSELGSAAEVERILQEMRHEQMEPDEACYHNVLKVLAVHPDCLLRDRIASEMRERWISITIHGMHDIMAGHIREGLIEQALELFESDRNMKRAAPKWIKDMLIYHLCDLGELDQALKMVKDRVAIGEVNISPSVWFYFFDHACSELHYDAIQFIWRQRIERNHLNPSSGQCLQALIVSARTGDVQIATDVFRILSQRGIPFKPHHYELLIATQVQAGDIRTGLTVVCIMHAVNMKPNMASLSPLLLYLRDDPDRSAEAFEILKDLCEERQVPTVAVNCILSSLARHNKHEDVITTYKSLHRICTQGPTVDTFNTLFRSCHRNNDKKTAMFFAAEMVELKIRPNRLTYDRLLLTCLKEKDYEDAFRYYEEMMHGGYQPRLGTWTMMVKVCCDARDMRAFELIRKMEELGLGHHTSDAVHYLKENWSEQADEAFGLYSSTVEQ